MGLLMGVYVLAIIIPAALLYGPLIPTYNHAIPMIGIILEPPSQYHPPVVQNTPAISLAIRGHDAFVEHSVGVNGSHDAVGQVGDGAIVIGLLGVLPDERYFSTGADNRFEGGGDGMRRWSEEILGD